MIKRRNLQFKMAQYSIGDALKKVMQEKHWKQRFFQATISNDWEKIMGETIARYTKEVKLVDDKLIIKTHIAALKSELMGNKDVIIEKVNAHLQANVVNDLIIS
jgi:predicted nucleic acid-binding Zn ribbon protein